MWMRIEGPYPRCVMVGAAMLIAGSAVSSSAVAKDPAVPAPYRPRAIALVQPSGGRSIPRDRAVVVFRFAASEPGDPIDARTFAVSVRGVDHGAHFQVTAGEAWGALGDPASADSLLAPGTHEVTARICSVRGACGTTVSMIAVTGNVDRGADAIGASSKAGSQPSARAQFIARLLDAVRRLLVP